MRGNYFFVNNPTDFASILVNLAALFSAHKLNGGGTQMVESVLFGPFTDFRAIRVEIFLL